jgi:hypothetical protein
VQSVWRQLWLSRWKSPREFLWQVSPKTFRFCLPVIANGQYSCMKNRHCDHALSAGEACLPTGRQSIVRSKAEIQQQIASKCFPASRPMISRNDVRVSVIASVAKQSVFSLPQTDCFEMISRYLPMISRNDVSI